MSDELPEGLPADGQASDGRSLPPARNVAMNWLARREYSRAEVGARLTERNYTPEEIDSAVAGLVADGLLCDQRFAESFVQNSFYTQ